VLGLGSDAELGAVATVVLSLGAAFFGAVVEEAARSCGDEVVGALEGMDELAPGGVCDVAGAD